MNAKLRIYPLIGLFLMVACTGQETQQDETRVIEVKPEKENISGALGKYIEVVSEDYEFEQDIKSSLVIRVRAIAKMEPKLLEDKTSKLFASLLSAKGRPITGTERMEIDYESREVLKELLINGQGEDIIYLSSYGSISQEQMNRVKMFAITSSLEDSEETSSDVVQEDEVATDEEETESSQKIEKAIGELEKEVEAFAKWVKKNPESDAVNAMAKYNKVLLKIHNLASKVDGHQHEMNTEQVARLLKIQTDMASAQQSFMDNYYSN